MNFFEEALEIEAMLETRKTTRGELAKSLGITESTLANKLRLLKLSADLQEKITKYKISERHARALLRIDYESQKLLVDRIINEKLTVASTEALVEIIRTDEAPKRLHGTERNEVINRFQNGLKESLNALSALQIDAKMSTNYYGKKLYITIAISEN